MQIVWGNVMSISSQLATILAGLSLTILPASLASANQDSTALLNLDAQPIDMVEPSYPEQAKLNGIEGWISFSLVVGEDGSTSHVEILDQSTPGIFEDSLKNAVGQWTFTPATQDGIAVKQTLRNQILKFHGRKIRTASSRFQLHYEKAQKALKRKDYAEALAKIEEAMSSGPLNLYESNYIYTLRSLVYSELGNFQQSAIDLEFALNAGEGFTPPDL
jgi:TonB family protein